MPPSAATADPTAVQSKPQGPPSPVGQSYSRAARKRGGLGAKGAMEHPNTEVTVLPDATREDQAERWGLTPDRLGDHLFTSDRRGHGPDDAVDVSGDSWDDHEDAERELGERGFVVEGGWSPVAIKNNRQNSGGITSHRGVLHPEEYVDGDALRALVERELGFTYEQIRSVYRQGPLQPHQRELRGQIDARLLALSRAGGHMAELGRALGFPIKADGHCRVMENALARARQEEN